MQNLAKSLVLIGCYALLGWAQTPETRQTETIAPGLEHLQIQRGDFNAEESERWQINALIVDPKLIRLELGLALDEIVGVETTSSLAARRAAIAAINGGYFRTTGIYRGEQMGALFSRAQWLSEPAHGRAALALAESGGQTRAATAVITAQMELHVGKATRAINGFNRPREKDELIVFTPAFHRTTLTAADGLEAVIMRGRVTAVRDGMGSQVIPANGWVLSAQGAAREWALQHLRIGVRVALKTAFKAEPPLPFKADVIIGAGPRLLAAGQLLGESESGFNIQTFYRARHPRTALGWRADGRFVLVAVDGRQPRQSVGMTIPELAVLMRELGCVEAINLDGGGSTTMVIKNKVVNSPSDAAGERAVSDALLLLPRAIRNSTTRVSKRKWQR
ncbi:MAG: phosphodiester glycosidase family protein [Acidobacteria bacterium]|nr:phosphodiester glycosidase family protein [Acidobacteriota bacterium]MBI3424971.1 phosphodiester glycosidase family protein [Acidobacteriota bacterium]